MNTSVTPAVRRIVHAAVLALVFLIAYWACTAFSRQVTAGSATLRIDATISAGAAIQVWINPPAHAPFREQISPGKRETLEFRGITEDILVLRIDPTDAADAQVVIHSVELLSDGKTFARFGPQELQSVWLRHDLAIESAQPQDGFAMRSTSVGGIMAYFHPIRLPRTANPWVLTVHEALFSTPVQPMIFLLPLLALASAIAGGRRVHVALVIVTALAAWELIPRVLAMHWASVPVNAAISRAAFMGESLRAGQVAVFSVAATVTIIAAAAGWLVRRRSRPQPQVDDAASATATPQPTRMARWMEVGGWVLAIAGLALILAPDLARTLASFSSQTYSPNWDLDNLLYWGYLTFHGQLPYRDFWFPYAGTYLFDLSWPLGPASHFAFDLASFGSVLWGVWLLIPEARLRGWIVVAVEAIAYRMPVIFQVERYLLGPALIVGYLAARYSTQRIWWRLGPFWLAVALVLIFDPPQLIYAGPAIVLLTCLDLWQVWRSTDAARRDAALRKALALPIWACAGGAILAGVVAIWLAAHGQLGAFLTLYARLGDSVEYSALPTQFNAVWPLYDLRYVVLFWPSGLIAIGIYELLRERNTRDRRLAEAMLAMGALTLFVLQKQLVRPIEYTMQTPLLLGTLLYGALTPRATALRFQMSKAAILAFAVAVMGIQGRGADLKNVLVEAPRRLTSSLATLTSPEANRRANREIYATRRFVNFQAGYDLIREIRSRWHPDGPLSLFALSDAASLYILTGQPTVWQSNIYNGSPVYDQDRMVEWLTRTPPDFVVFDPARMTFDNIATPVRAPRIVGAVIAGYVPAGKVGSFEVLRPRRAGEMVSFAYWRERLGDAIDLGHLPELLDVSRRGDCVAGQACDEYLALTFGLAVPGKSTIALDINGSPFRLRFERTAGVDHYVIPLSRLWVWEAAKAAGTRVRVVGFDPPTRDARIVTRRVAYDHRRLY